MQSDGRLVKLFLFPTLLDKSPLTSVYIATFEKKREVRSPLPNNQTFWFLVNYMLFYIMHYSLSLFLLLPNILSHSVSVSLSRSLYLFLTICISLSFPFVSVSLSVSHYLYLSLFPFCFCLSISLSLSVSHYLYLSLFPFCPTCYLTLTNLWGTQDSIDQPGKHVRSTVNWGSLWWCSLLSLKNTTILLTKITAAQNEVTLIYLRVRGLYFLAVIFAASIYREI